MPFKSWNIVKPGDEYKDKDGNEKRRWDPVGTLLFNEDKNRFSIKLHLTGEWYQCFENEPRKIEAVPAPVSEETEPAKW